MDERAKIPLIFILIMLVSSYLWAGEMGEHATVDVLVKASSSWDGQPLPDYKDGDPEITILRIVIPPKTQLPLHKHPVINAGVLLKGNLVVETDTDETLYLKEGDAIVELVDKWHHGKNEGDQPAEIIVFYAGIKGVDTTIKKDG